MTELDLPPRFEVVGLLGKGGMGVVYEVLDRDRTVTIALKTLDIQRTKNVAAIREEFRVLTGIAHPNVVAFHELFEHAGRWFFTMECVAGAELLEWVRGSGGARDETLADGYATHVDEPAHEIVAGELDAERLRDAVRQLARGLLAFHRAGRVHRDVKPSNVRVTSEGRVVLLDFGVAVEGGKSSRIGGTVRYMAPEQAQHGAAVRAPADAYGLGVVIYEALTGSAPFEGKVVDVLAQKLELDAPEPSTKTDAVLPEDLVALALALLRREPDARPNMREVLEMIEERREPRETAVEERRAPLVGRERLIAACRDAWKEAKRNGPVAISLTGPDGIGRTRLLDEVVAALRSDGAICVQSRADARESIPFRGLDALVDHLVRAEARSWEGAGTPNTFDDIAYLASLFPTAYQLWPELRGERSSIVDPIEVRRRGFRALSRWTRRHAPLALMIDDAHDLDGDGLALLTALLRPGRQLPLLVVMAASEDPPLRTRVLPISPLTDREATSLARALVDSGPVDELVTSAEGRPGWLVQLALETRTSLGHDIEAAVRRRLETLPATARMLLTACVLAYTPLDIGLASAATGASRESVVRDAQRLTAAHLLRQEARLEVPAGIVRDAVRRSVPKDTAAALHLALAEALEARPRINRELVARHYSDAGKNGLAAALANRALREAEKKLAFDRSAELAGFLAVLDPKRAGAHLARRAQALAYAGRGSDAAEAYLEAIPLTDDPVLVRSMRRLAAEELIRRGQVERGVELMREALAAVGLPMPRNAVRALPALLLRRARLLIRGNEMTERTPTPFELERIDTCWSACSLLMTVDIYWGAYFQTRHLQFALDSGNAACAARALAFETPLLAAAGRHERASRAAAGARQLAERSGDPHAEGLVEGCIGLAFLQQGQFTAALRATSKGESILRERTFGSSWELSSMQMVRAWALAWRGDLRTLRAYLQDARAAAEAKGDVLTTTNIVLGTGVWARLLDDEPDEARADIASVLERWPVEGMQIAHLFALIADGIISVYERDVTCIARIDAAWPEVRRSLLLQNQLLRITLLDIRARLALVAGDRAGASKLCARLGRENSNWSSGLAAAIAAQLAADGRSSWKSALRRFERAEMALHAAAARHVLGDSFSSSDWALENRPAAPEKLLASFLPAAR